MLARSSSDKPDVRFDRAQKRGERTRTLLWLGLLVLSALVLTMFGCGSTESNGEEPGVSRTLSATSAPPGGEIRITLQPQGIEGFYAVREEPGDLEVTSNSASTFTDGVFVQLDASSFDYSVRIPVDAASGSRYRISGEYWTDPATRLPVTPAESLITVD